MVINTPSSYSFTQYSSYYEEKNLDFNYYEHFLGLESEITEEQIVSNYKNILEQIFSDYIRTFREIPPEIITHVIKGLIKIVSLIKEEIKTEVSLSGDYIFSDLNPDRPLLFEIILLVKTEEKKKEKYIEKYEDLWLSLVPLEVDKYFILTVKWD